MNRDILLEDSSGNISNETIQLTTFANNDSLYLYNSNGESIAGATVVVINDTSFTTVTSDVNINAADYDNANNTIAEKTGTYSRTGTTITATVTSGHNFSGTGTQYATIDFSDALQ